MIFKHQSNGDTQSPSLCIRTTKGITTIGDISILSTSPIPPSRTPRSTTRRLLARLRNFRDDGELERGRQADTDKKMRNGGRIAKGKTARGDRTLSSRIPRFSAPATGASTPRDLASSSTLSPSPRALPSTRPSPIHGVSDLVFDPFYYTKLVLGTPGDVTTPKRPGPLAHAPTLEGVSEVDERDEEDRFAMEEDAVSEDSDMDDNVLLWRPPSPMMLPPPLPEAPSYHHYEDDFIMYDDPNLNQASGYASSSSSRTGSPTPPATPTPTQFRSLDVDMDDDGYGDHAYDSDASEGSSMDAEIDVVEEDSDDEFDDVGMSTSRFLHRTAYETILTSTVHQYLGYMEDGGRVTVELPIAHSDESFHVAGRRAVRLRTRRGITYPRRFSSLMGVSLAIMKDQIGVSTGF